METDFSGKDIYVSPDVKSGPLYNVTTGKPKTIEEVRRQVVYEPKVEYVVVEKKSDNDMFTLEEYRQMRAILEVIKENQKKA